MRQAQINVRTRACSRTSIARTKQAALTHNVRGKELINVKHNGNCISFVLSVDSFLFYRYKVNIFCDF